jgi:hypothetical protein
MNGKREEATLFMQGNGDSIAAWFSGMAFCAALKRDRKKSREIRAKMAILAD